MKRSSIDQLLFARISDAGLKDPTVFRDRLARHLAIRLKLGDVLAGIPDQEIYLICNPPDSSAGKKEAAK